MIKINKKLLSKICFNKNYNSLNKKDKEDIKAILKETNKLRGQK